MNVIIVIVNEVALWFEMNGQTWRTTTGSISPITHASLTDSLAVSPGAASRSPSCHNVVSVLCFRHSVSCKTRTLCRRSHLPASISQNFTYGQRPLPSFALDQQLP